MSNEKVAYAIPLEGYREGTTANRPTVGQQDQQHMQGQGVQYDANGQQIVSNQPGGNTSGVALGVRVDQGTAAQDGPPVGRWKDGLCDCFSNCWPSCYCSFCCCEGIWLLSQISKKTGFASFSAVFITYIVAQTIAVIITAATGIPIVLIPPCALIIFTVFLRLHMVKRYTITSDPCLECMSACFCCYCSTAQMARHMVGYKKFLDGDSDIDMPDYYSTV